MRVMPRVSVANWLNTLVGAKATNALSEYFSVYSIRNNKIAKAKFSKGKLKIYKEDSWKNGKIISGTSVRFKPDKEIFKESIYLEYEPLKNN